MYYEYATGIVNGSKYPAGIRDMINAVYSPAILEIDRGNPFIEALPDAKSNDAIVKTYYKPFPLVPSVNSDEVTQRAEIQLLKNMRFPLPFAVTLEKQFSDSLLTSYRARSGTLVKTPTFSVVNNASAVQSQSFRAAAGGDSGIGVTLLGIGGCGKSVTVETMLSHYPQVLRHSWPDCGEYVQIIWVYVVTPANANLSDLYVAIARSIDEAIGNLEPYYAREILKHKSIGSKADYIATLIRLFSIGAIVLDEVQNIAHGSNRSSSFDSLMTVINTTKVSLCVVGTEAAFSAIFREYYIARRAGSIINASNYCTNRHQFDVMMRYIMSVNWFRKDVEIEAEDKLLDALYGETCGVIDRMITLWSEIQLNYVSAKKDYKPSISSVYIKRISNESRPMMAMYTDQMLRNSFFSEIQGDDPVNISADFCNLRANAAKNSIKTMIDGMEHPQSAEHVYAIVKDNLLLNGRVYNDVRILEVTKRVLAQKSSEGLGDFDLAKKVITALNRTKSDKRYGAKSSSNDSSEKVSPDLDKFVIDFT